MLEQLELQLADLEEDAAQADAAARLMAVVASDKITVPSFERRKPARRPLPEHLPRERVVYPSPSACPRRGGTLPVSYLRWHNQRGPWRRRKGAKKAVKDRLGMQMRTKKGHALERVIPARAQTSLRGCLPATEPVNIRAADAKAYGLTLLELDPGRCPGIERVQLSASETIAIPFTNILRHKDTGQ